MRPWPPAAFGLALTIAAAGAAAQGDLPAIRGVVTVPPSLVHNVDRDDRLIIKLYHPKDGFELDAKYQIVPRFTLPFPFLAAPSIDMSGRTKFDSYVVELFTDKDEDPVAIAPGELFARTPEPVPLGTTGLQLELDATREQAGAANEEPR
jgi:hypothetical protein